jgi:hypothetical protein
MAARKPLALVSGSVNELAATDALDAAVKPRVQAVTYADPMSLDCNLYDHFTITLAGNPTINFTNGVDLKPVVVRLKQDGTGSRTVTWGTMVRFSVDIASILLTTTANKTDYIGFLYNAADSKWDVVSFTRGF